MKYIILNVSFQQHNVISRSSLKVVQNENHHEWFQDLLKMIYHILTFKYFRLYYIILIILKASLTDFSNFIQNFK